MLSTLRTSTLTAAVLLVAVLVLAQPAGAAAREDAGPPLPGGVYRGHTARDATISISVADATTPGGAMRGVVSLACARGSARFLTRDGSFVAHHRTRGGKVSWSVRGSFSVDRAHGRVLHVSGGRRCGWATYTAALRSPAGVLAHTVRYGPMTIGGMAMGAAGMPGGHGNMRTFSTTDIARPCADCFVVGMAARLVDGAGRTQNYDTGVMLHHTVLFNAAAKDASCPRWPQRFFASGNERTPFVLPAGYGYLVRAGDRWNGLTELMNVGAATKRVFVEMTYYVAPASAHLREVRPLWLDVDNCADSEYAIPAGRSDSTWSFEVPPAIAGRVVAIGGHLHDDGVRILARDATTDRVLCRSRAGFGRNSAYQGHIESMTGCVGAPLGRIRAGDTLRLQSMYDSPAAQQGVMGIMLAYVARS